MLIIDTLVATGAADAMSESGEVAFKRQLYQSMVGQLLFLKTEMEGWRSQNVWGTTFWMFNEIWPTGGWGSIECKQLSPLSYSKLCLSLVAAGHSARPACCVPPWVLVTTLTLRWICCHRWLACAGAG